MPEETGTQNVLRSIMGSAIEFATPFVQRVFTTPTSERTYQEQRLTDTTLNGSGPNDPTLSRQAPLGLLDFIWGRNMAQSGGGGAQTSPGTADSTLMLVGLGLVAILAAFFILKK